MTSSAHPLAWPTARADASAPRTAPAIVPSAVRVTLNGKRQEYPAGTLINPPLGGQNYSLWNQNLPTDGATAKAEGQTAVRLLLRTCGNYGGKPTDSYDGACPGTIDNFNRVQHYNEVKMFTDQGIWVSAGIDSNCLQSGMQDTTTENLCAAGGGASDPNWPATDPATWHTIGGRNLFNDPNQLSVHLARWKLYVQLLCPLPYIWCWEVLPEPLVAGSNSYNYNSTWTPRLAAYIRAVRDVIRSVDPYTPIMAGGRLAYEHQHLEEIILQLVGDGTTGQDGKPALHDIIWTWDDLSDITRDLGNHADTVLTVAALRDKYNVAIGCQSSGTRRDDDLQGNATSSTPSANPHAGLMSAIFQQRALGIPATFWARRNGNGSTNLNGYALDILDGLGGATLKQPEHDLVVSQYAITLAALEAAAIAAATAAGGWLFYVKPDFSNVWQDAAGTTPVTAVGQNLGKITPVVGVAATLSFTATLFPTVRTASIPYDPGSGLVNITPIDARPVIQFVGGNNGDNLIGSSTFFVGTDDQTVIVSYVPQVGTAVQVALQVGVSTAANQAYPKMQTTAAKFAQAMWQDDAAHNVTCIDSLTTEQGFADGPYVPLSNGYPLVESAVRAGTAFQMYRNGLLAATGASAVQGVMTPTRFRVGSDTANQHGVTGQIGGFFVAKAGVTSAQRQAIERFLGWLVAAPVAV